MITYRQLLKQGEEILKSVGIEDYRFDAFQLLMQTAGMNSDSFFLNSDKNASDHETLQFRSFIERRKNYEPLQYILGKWSFYESDFFVGKGVLIPRPETEELVEHCCSFINKNNVKTVYDLCTGSGCIGLSIAKKFPHIQCCLFDYFDDALYYAEKNKEFLALGNVTVIKADITEEVAFELPDADVIVSNPPYIRSDEIDSLQKEVQQEPVTALDGGDDGLVFYRAIESIWLKKLKKGGMIAVECGENQADAVTDVFSLSCNCNSVKDLYNIERFVIGVKK